MTIAIAFIMMFMIFCAFLFVVWLHHVCDLLVEITNCLGKCCKILADLRRMKAGEGGGVE